MPRATIEEQPSYPFSTELDVRVGESGLRRPPRLRQIAGIGARGAIENVRSARCQSSDTLIATVTYTGSSVAQGVSVFRRSCARSLSDLG